MILINKTLHLKFALFKKRDYNINVIFFIGGDIMTKLNEDVIISTKEYIINTYKHLIENMHIMHPHEVCDY